MSIATFPRYKGVKRAMHTKPHVYGVAIFASLGLQEYNRDALHILSQSYGRAAENRKCQRLMSALVACVKTNFMWIVTKNLGKKII